MQDTREALCKPLQLPSLQDSRVPFTDSQRSDPINVAHLLLAVPHLHAFCGCATRQALPAGVSDLDTLKIGVQIRSGDQTFRDGNDRATMEFFAAFFDCAEQVEKSRRHSKDQKVRRAAGACRCFVLLWYVHRRECQRQPAQSAPSPAQMTR